MNKIQFSQLRKSNGGDIESTLPLQVTLDGTVRWVLLSIEQYSKLVKLTKFSQFSQSGNLLTFGRDDDRCGRWR